MESSAVSSTAQVRIKLPKGEWFFNPKRRLGRPGGFGEVFEGTDAKGQPVAVKKLKVSTGEAAHRELKIAEDLAGRSFSHVLDVFDSGDDAEGRGYYVVMPRAERSLAQQLERGLPSAIQAIDILLQVAEGLSEVPTIVHRDLKPDNVLFHDGKWKVADFGIARFVEDATSTNTVREFLTPTYAAPEQWLNQRATPATDVYALSCVGYELLHGWPPFAGPTMADFQRQHTSETPPVLGNVDPRLRAILVAGLRKAPTGRPSVARVIQVLRDVVENPTPRTPALAALQAVNAKEAERISAAAAEAERLRRQAADRAALIQSGVLVLQNIFKELEELARTHAPDAQYRSNLGQFAMSMGAAELHAESQGGVPPNVEFGNAKWDVVAIGLIDIVQKAPHAWQHGATLWYMKTGKDSNYRWHEVSYKYYALARMPIQGPFAIQEVGNDIYQHADLAAGPGMHVVELEFGPVPVDDENADAFLERWLNRFVLAYEGRLRPF